MSDYTRTTNYALYKPVPGEDDDVWGDHWNANADTLDGIIRQLDVRGSGGGVLLVTDFLPAGQPDGINDNTPYLQDALDAAAGVTDTSHRELAPGASTLLIPAASAAYIVTSLSLPSNTHLVIEQGATIKLADNAYALPNPPPVGGNTILYIPPATANVIIELYGTIDGNVVNQPPASAPGYPASGGIAGGPCSNVFVTGTGVVKNCKLWGISISACTNGEARGILVSNCGNSCEFTGLSTKIAVSSGTYTSGTGVTVLTTATAHGINPGDTFTLTAVPHDIGFSYLLGEYVADPGTTGTTLNFTAPINLGAPVIPTDGSAFVGTCNKSYNVGFTDCIVEDIQDIGLCLYGGCVGSFIRGCEVRGCSGPILFSDNSQPGSNVDCEISGNWSHDNPGGGAGAASNAFGIGAHNSRICNNVSANNLGGGMSVSGTGIEVFGNTIHGCIPSAPAIANSIYHSFNSALVLSGNEINAWGNAIRDPQPAYSARTSTSIVSGTYTSNTGAVSLVTKAAHNIPVGGSFYVTVLRGTGPVASLKGKWTATAGTGGTPSGGVAGTVLNFTGPIGLSPAPAIFDGGVLFMVFYPVNNSITTGTYDSPTGNVSLTTLTPHGYNVGDHFVLSGLAGTGSSLGVLTGMQMATAGTTGSTLNCTDSAGLAAMTIAGGRIYPPNIGINVPEHGFHGADAKRGIVAGNYISDDQPTRVLTAALAGVWGVDGYSAGNTYGGRLSIPPDVSVYNPAPGGSIQGLSHDNIYLTMLGNAPVTGQTTFYGNFPVLPGSLQSQGLTPGWNYTSGAGDVDFYCGRGGGAPGGFNFLQVSGLGITGGTYTSGAVSLTTRPPHGLLAGSSFVVDSATNQSVNCGALNGTFAAGAATSGTTVTYTVATGLTIGAITGGTVTPPGFTTALNVVSGTYTGGTGLVTLTTSAAHGMAPGTSFVAANITDGSPDASRLNGTFAATAGTAGSVLNYTIATGLTIPGTIRLANITPAGTAGGVVDTTVGVAGSLLANDGYGNTRVGGAVCQGGFQTGTIANGGTLAVLPNMGLVYVNNSSSIATGTITLPAVSFNAFTNNELEIVFANLVGTVTITPAAGNTILTPPTTVTTAGAAYRFIRNGTVWIRRVAA